MNKANWHDVLKLDFSEGSALRSDLLESLLQRPDAPVNMEEEIPMKATIRHSSRVLAFALIAILLLCSAALAAMKSYSLGPFAMYTQSDTEDLRKEIDEVVNGNRDVWEGKLFFADKTPVTDLAAYMLEASKSNQPYEIYNADGKLSGLKEVDGKFILITTNDWGVQYKDDADILMYFDTLDAALPNLYENFKPSMPKALPEGYVLSGLHVYTDEEGNLYPREQNKYLNASFKKGDHEILLFMRYMDEETSFESTSSADIKPLTINGHEAVQEGNILAILVGDILYEFMPNTAEVPVEDLIDMAASI